MVYRAEQQAPRASDAGKAGQRRPACHDNRSGRGHASRTPRRDDVGSTPEAGVTPGILPSALRVSLRLFQIAPGDLVGIDIDQSAGLLIGTAAGCRDAVGYRDVPDETCCACGGAVRIIACIGDPVVIDKILAHLDANAPEPNATRRPV